MAPAFPVENIHIIIPPDDSFKEINTCIPSLGVAVLSGYLTHKGFEHSITDLNRMSWFDRELHHAMALFNDAARVAEHLEGASDGDFERATEVLLSRIPVEDGVVYAFSMDIMPRYVNIGSILCMARALKRRCDCRIVVGGIFYSEWLHTLMAHGFIDFCVNSLDTYSGCGHEPLAMLCRELKATSPDMASIPGLGYRDSNTVRSNPPRDTDIFSPPDFSRFDLDSYRTQIPEKYASVCQDRLLVLPYRFSAGCKFNCAYCTNSRFPDSAALSAKEVVRQLEDLNRDTGARHFLFLNPCFNISRDFARELAGAIVDSGLKIEWSDCATFHGLDAETVDLLSRAGCRRLFFGFESLTGNIGRYVTKNLDLPHIVDVLEMCHDCNIWTGLDIITGFPYETPREVSRLARFLRQYSSLIDSVTINRFMLFPHTRFFREAEKFRVRPRPGMDRDNIVRGMPYDETQGRAWQEICADVEQGFEQIRMALEGSLGYWNDAEMLPILFGLFSKHEHKCEFRNIYREIIASYSKKREPRQGGSSTMGVLGSQKDFARDIKITVKSIKGRGCRGNHYVGQTYYVVDSLTPQGICMNAFNALMPSLNLLMFKGAMPWGTVNTLDVACPDSTTQVVFELTVITEEDAEKERENMLKAQAKRAKKIGAGTFKQGRK